MKQSPNQFDRYQQDGAVCLRNLLDDHWLASLEAGLASNLQHPTHRTSEYRHDNATGQSFFFDALMIAENSNYRDVILNSPLAQTVASFMQSETAVVSHITVFVRSAGIQKRTPWHCDQAFWPYRGSQTCSTWFSLDPMPVETSLEFVRGSHRWTKNYARPDFSDDPDENYLLDETNRLEPFPDIEAHRENFDILAWETSPGDCLLFHGQTAHGGSGNLPPELGRRSISIQWLGDDVVYQPKPGGVDPDFTAELAACGIQPGMSLASKVCPVVWRNQDFTGEGRGR